MITTNETNEGRAKATRRYSNVNHVELLQLSSDIANRRVTLTEKPVTPAELASHYSQELGKPVSPETMKTLMDHHKIPRPRRVPNPKPADRIAALEERVAALEKHADTMPLI